MSLDFARRYTPSREQLYTEAKHVLFPSNERGLGKVVDRLKESGIKGGVVIGVAGSGDTLLTLATTIKAEKIIGKDINEKALAFTTCLTILGDTAQDSEQFLRLVFPEYKQKNILPSFLRKKHPEEDRVRVISEILERNDLNLTFEEFEAIRKRGVNSPDQGSPTFSSDITEYLQLLNEGKDWITQKGGKKYLSELLSSGNYSLYEGAIETTNLDEIEQNAGSEKISIIYLSNVDVHIGKKPLIDMVNSISERCSPETRIVFVQGNQLVEMKIEEFLTQFSPFYSREVTRL